MSEVVRSFELARKVVNKEVVKEPDENGVMREVLAYPNAQLPEYQTLNSAGADFFCAEEVVIPSIWSAVAYTLVATAKGFISNWISQASEYDEGSVSKVFSPTMVHTGIKSNMGQNEVLKLFNRSSNPKNLGLVIANGVGIVDADYYNCCKNDGEILFAFYNFKPWSVTINVGDRVGQGVFETYLRPTIGLRVKDAIRTGGHGSTN